MAEEVHTQDKWAKMEARNLKRFVTAVGGLSALELTRLGTKPKEASPRRYDAEMLVSRLGNTWVDGRVAKIVGHEHHVQDAV